MGSKVRLLLPGMLGFHCPGCGVMHVVKVAGEGAWHWNQSFDKPTFTPSIFVRSGHYAPEHKGDCWCKYWDKFGRVAPFNCLQCHFTMTEGRISYLPESMHALRGHTVDLPELAGEPVR